MTFHVLRTLKIWMHRENSCELGACFVRLYFLWYCPLPEFTFEIYLLFKSKAQCELIHTKYILRNIPTYSKYTGPSVLLIRSTGFLCIDLPFSPIYRVSRKFGKDIFNIKDAVLISQKDPFLRREPIQSQSSFLLYYW